MSNLAAYRATKWNRRYTNEGAEWATRPPNTLLTEHADLLPNSGLAVDAGCGVGNNSVFLAQHGLAVVSLDVSEVGVRILKQRAHNLPIYPAVWNLAQPWLPANRFDLIINFNFLERATFPHYRHALKRNGVLVFSTFVQPTPDHPDEPFFLKAGELQAEFGAFETLHSSQTSYFHKRSNSTRYVEHLIARKG